MLVRHFAELHRQHVARGLPARHKAVVCLVPTTILVAQQAAVFRRHANVTVGEYTGNSRLDKSGQQRWQAVMQYALSPWICVSPLCECVCLA